MLLDWEVMVNTIFGLWRINFEIYVNVFYVVKFLMAFILVAAAWLSVLEMRLRRTKRKNRINKVSIKRNWDEILKLRKEYGKDKEEEEEI